MLDMNSEKHHKLTEFLSKEKDQVAVSIKKVVEIGDDEKRILLRKYSRHSR